MNDSLSDQQPKETEDPLFVKGAMTGMVDAQIADAWPTKATQAPAPAPEGVQRQNSTVYVLNERGTNRWWAQVQPGHDDDDRRVSDQECEAVAAAIRAALQAPAVVDGQSERLHPYGRCTITGPAEDVAFIFRHLPDAGEQS